MFKKILALMFLVIVLVGCGVADLYENTGNINMPQSSEMNDSDVKDNTDTVILDENTELKDCEFNSLDDSIHYMSEYTGKPLVVHFWGPWCDPCLEEMVYFEELYNEYKDRVQFLMISTTNDKVGDKLLDYVDEYPFEIYYSKADKVNSTYELWNIPTTYFVNEEGVIVKSFEIKQEYEVLRSCIEALLGDI